jgi:MOSC domain-containing protein YiiM
MGELISISFNPRSGFPRQRHERAEVRADYGVVGDHLAGKSKKRHLNIMDAERLEELETEGFPAWPGELGETLVVRGVRLDTLPVGTQIRIGEGVVAETTGLREPCYKLTPLDPRMPEDVIGRVGMMARVLEGGEIWVGNPVVVLDPIGEQKNDSHIMAHNLR